jgi:hypothetical protein
MALATKLQEAKYTGACPDVGSARNRPPQQSGCGAWAREAGEVHGWGGTRQAEAAGSERRRPGKPCNVRGARGKCPSGGVENILGVAGWINRVIENFFRKFDACW